MLIKAAPKPAAQRTLGEWGSLQSVGPRDTQGGNPAFVAAGQENAPGVVRAHSPQPALFTSSAQCTPLTSSTLTTQLQTHTGQEVFLSKPVSSASSLHTYIWLLQHNFIYCVRERGRFLSLFFFSFFLSESSFWYMFYNGKFL